MSTEFYLEANCSTLNIAIPSIQQPLETCIEVDSLSSYSLHPQELGVGELVFVDFYDAASSCMNDADLVTSGRVVAGDVRRKEVL